MILITPAYVEIVGAILLDGTSGGFSVCEAGKGLGGSVADDFDCSCSAAKWAAENGYTVMNPLRSAMN